MDKKLTQADFLAARTRGHQSLKSVLALYEKEIQTSIFEGATRRDIYNLLKGEGCIAVSENRFNVALRESGLCGGSKKASAANSPPLRKGSRPRSKKQDGKNISYSEKVRIRKQEAEDSARNPSGTPAEMQAWEASNNQ